MPEALRALHDLQESQGVCGISEDVEVMKSCREQLTSRSDWVPLYWGHAAKVGQKGRGVGCRLKAGKG